MPLFNPKMASVTKEENFKSYELGIKPPGPPPPIFGPSRPPTTPLSVSYS